MSKASVLEMASDLVNDNPDAAKLLIQLSNSETGSEILNALDAYDAEVEDSTVSL
jgi:hypothetical protein